MSDEGPFGRRSPEPPSGPAPEPPPERRPPPRSPSRMPSQSTWIVGILLVAILAYVGYNTVTTEGPGSEGVTAGNDIPPFAAPLALANLTCKNSDGEEAECDANVSTAPVDGGPIACDARGENIVNSCELTEEGPLVLAFLAEPSGRCVDQVDVLDAMAPRFPDVSFAVVAIRGEHDELNALIREQGWEIPVAYDHDGAVANAFSVAICPTITFAAQGGEVTRTTLGTVGEAEIAREIRELR